jgi:hypothetical protein
MEYDLICILLRRNSMSESIVIIDSSKIRSGRLEEVKMAMNELVKFVKENEPKIIAYNVYINKEGTMVTVFQVHPDSESAEFHMKVAGHVFSNFVDFIDMLGMDIYGKPSNSLMERLLLKAKMLGSKNLTVHELHSGFDRYIISE